jgi:arylsulfatase A-like enzyme
VVVTTDDQDVASLSPWTMPNVTRLLAQRGTTFTDYVASGPLCCPSRAVFLTGQYGHNNGVLWNYPDPYGDLRDKRNTLPVWLRRSGYRTAHVGRYLNVYERGVDEPNEVAPGWDEWHTILEPLQYYDYKLRVNGRAVRYGSRGPDYLTRVINRTAVNLIRHHGFGRRPLFMAIDHLAPHTNPAPGTHCELSATPDPRDAHLFSNAPLPRPASFNERDVSDKPSFIRARPGLGPAANGEITRHYRCRLASLRAVDRGVGQIHRALRAEGELDDTVIVFTSDNGWFAGQHRVPRGKTVPYEESLRVPLVVRLPAPLSGLRTPRATGKPVANIDLPPTILRIAGARPCQARGDCRVLDGRSLLPLLRGRGGAWPEDRGILLELESREPRVGPNLPCDYEGIRAGGHVYLEHHSATGAEGGRCRRAEETELYDLRRDPFQLSNLAPATAGTAAARREASLAARLARLRRCAGVAGRDPRPVGGSHCE